MKTYGLILQKKLFSYIYPTSKSTSTISTPRGELRISSDRNDRIGVKIRQNPHEAWAVHSGPQELFSIAHNYGRAQP